MLGGVLRGVRGTDAITAATAGGIPLWEIAGFLGTRTSAWWSGL